MTDDIRNLFLFVGADPATGWLDGCGVTLDRGGFVVTGAQSDLNQGRLVPQLETSVPGVFAVGDVRSGSGQARGRGDRRGRAGRGGAARLFGRHGEAGAVASASIQKELGGTTPMAQIVVTYKTPTDPKAFDKYYAETHIPLAKKLPGLRKYEVSQGPVAARPVPRAFTWSPS